MIFQDNVIKEYLKNVYFITGTACGGKTTVSRALGAMYGVPVYDIDERFAAHREMSDPEFQPCMNRRFRDADEFFGRSVEEYKSWLLGNSREQLDFVLLDLVRLSEHSRVLCDCHITAEIAETITEPGRVAFLVRKPVNMIEEYCRRPDHEDFRDFINSASDVEKAKAVCDRTLCELNEPVFDAVRSRGFFMLERDGSRTVEQTARLVAEHFGW